MVCPISTNKYGDFVDPQGRKITLKGINVDASAKLPANPEVPSQTPSNSPLFWDGDHVSFVGRPFPLSEARGHFERIKSWGYNVIRYVITWEALEHEGPGIYDEDFIEYTIEILKVIHDVGGLYVFLDSHQDTWLRFSGGSGAPLWTFYAAGLDPKKFRETGSTILHGDYYDDNDGHEGEPDSEVYAKMLWPSNYFKLACLTMFTLFFTGTTFAPNATLDGENIQNYLQKYFFQAFGHLLQRIHDAHKEYFDAMLFGIELMNEPNMGLYGRVDFDSLPENQRLRVGPTPTLMQSLKLGVGKKQVVDDYAITITGPQKTGETEIDPKGVSVWLSEANRAEVDAKYGWTRGPDWRIGECLWAQNGFWDPVTGSVMDTDFFSKRYGQKLDQETFINGPFIDYFKGFQSTMRAVSDKIYLLIHPLVLEPPPKLVDREDIMDGRIIYAPHYYDGLTLMSKTWNRYYNVDTLGIMRGRYWNPLFGLVIGEGNIRRCIRNQFVEIKTEGKRNLGENVPILMTETGVPFDMDGKKAYKDGDFALQTSALDAIGYALEGADISHTWWCYCHINSHKWGDQWNCEDFSFYSKDDEPDDAESVFSNESKDVLLGSRERTVAMKSEEHAYAGVRAANAVIRPYAVKIHGSGIKECEFDQKTKKYRLVVSHANSCFKEEMEELCTEIFVPKHHYNLKNDYDVKVFISSGNYIIDEQAELLRWHHGGGEQTIEISVVEEKGSGIFCW